MLGAAPPADSPAPLLDGFNEPVLAAFKFLSRVSIKITFSAVSTEDLRWLEPAGSAISSRYARDYLHSVAMREPGLGRAMQLTISG